MERKTRLERLGPHAGLFDALADHAPVGVFVADAGGACVYANERLCELLGRTRKQLLADGWERGLHPEDAGRVGAEWADAAAVGRDFHGEYRFLRPDGSVRWVEGSAAAVRDAHGLLLGRVGCCVDLTARKLSDSRYEELFEHANDAMFAATVEGEITLINLAGEALTGYDRDELLGMNVFGLIAPADRQRARETFARRLAGGENEMAEYQLIGRNGRRAFVEVAGRLIEEDGRPVALEAIVRDTSERHALEERLRQEALHDPLTGLANRTLFRDRLEHALSRAARTGAKVAVMLLDLDDFKMVNDSLGHRVGDELLITLAPRLRLALRASDSVARLGGDEFGLLFEDVVREQELAGMAERLLTAIGQPTMIDHSEMRVTASLGIAIAEPADTAETALSNADSAMYKAKSAGKGGFEIYNEAMRSRLHRELMLTTALAAALREGRLDVYYQPIVSLADGRILAVEALARWNHPDWGWVQPGEFIPIAEDHGLMVELGQQVLTHVAGRAAGWRAGFPDALPLGTFVNVSPGQLSQPGFVDAFTSTLTQHGSTLADIGIEITERALIDETNAKLARNIEELARLGIQLILDDFGTGYSSLAALKQLPLTAVKIDRSFIRAICSDSDVAPITTATISLGHALGLIVIAEGVETRLQADYLGRSGCDSAQGYHYARPQPADQITALLEAEHHLATAA